jgi:hypothetical protein
MKITERQSVLSYHSDVIIDTQCHGEVYQPRCVSVHELVAR